MYMYIQATNKIIYLEQVSTMITHEEDEDEAGDITEMKTFLTVGV